MNPIIAILKEHNVSDAKIQEVLLHCTVYCGMPAGIEAFRAAKEALEEWQAQKS